MAAGHITVTMFARGSGHLLPVPLSPFSDFLAAVTIDSISCVKRHPHDRLVQDTLLAFIFVCPHVATSGIITSPMIFSPHTSLYK